MHASEDGFPKEGRVAQMRAVAAAAGRLLCTIKSAVVSTVHVVPWGGEVEKGHKADAVNGSEGALQLPRAHVEVCALVAPSERRAFARRARLHVCL